MPCGRLTEILGRRGSGRTTLVRQLVTAAIDARRWVAIVDGSRTLSPCDWVSAGSGGRLWVIRPADPDRSAWCADMLLRSGAFSLVVLDGIPSLSRPVGIRLTRLARGNDVALVVVGEESGIVGSAVRIRTVRTREPESTDGPLLPADSGSLPATGSRCQSLPLSHFCFQSRFPLPSSRLTLLVSKGGWHHPVEVGCAIPMARRLCTHPQVPDRRGVAKRNRQGQRVSSPHRRGTAEPGGGEHDTKQQTPEYGRGERALFVGGTLPDRRRCAEPVIKRDGFLLAR